MSSRMFRLGITAAVIIGMCVAGASFSFAQEFRATIIGQVSDPSGAPIPGATVTAVQHSTNQTYTARSNADGVYSVDFVNPGQFTVTVEAQGFSKKVYPNVTLQAGQKLNLNVTLVVGSVRQQVTVTAAQGLLNTTSASSGGVIDQTKVQNLPSANGRGVFIDVVFAQGVRQSSYGDIVAYPWGPTSIGSTITVNGSPTGENMYFVDGAPVSPGGTVEFIPEQDAVQELQATASGGAQYGPGTGGVFSAVIKQGTNNFHGDVYDYIGNAVGDANTYASNLTGIPRGQNTHNDWGATLGGPVRKGKTFFFFGFEDETHYQPGPVTDSVPTAAMRAGDFAATGYTIYDPSTVTCTKTTSTGCSTYGRTEFPNDTIPQSDVSPIGASIMSLYPQPTLPGTLDNYVVEGNNHYNYYQEIGRVDHDFSDSTRLSGMFSKNDTYTPSPGNAFSDVATTITHPTSDDENAELDLTHTLSPSAVADLRASFGRYSTFAFTGTAVQQNYSVPGLSMPFVPTTLHQNIAPEVSVGSYTRLFGNTANGSVSNTWYLSPSLDQSKGRHTLQYGFEYMDIQSGASGVPGEPNGTFSFSGQWSQENPLTAATGSGNPLADLLLGYPSTGSVDWSINDFITYHYYAAYLQDDLKARRNLTLNLGLRWDANTSPSERHNGINGSFCFTCTNPYTSQINYAAYPTLENPLTGGLTFAGVTAPRAPDNVDLNDWQPRLGIAWAITPKTVFRAGFGIYYNIGNPSTTDTGFSQSTSFVESLNGNVNPSGYFLSGKPYPSGVLAPAGAKEGLETDAGNGFGYYSPSGAIPWTQHWSVGFQRALPKQILLDVEYDGSHTHNIDVTQQWGTISLAQQEACFQNNAICNDSVSNPFYGVLPAASTLGSSTTLDAWELKRNEPLFAGISQSNDPIGYSNYNSLAVQVSRKIKSLDFVGNYAWANNMYANAYLNSGDFQNTNLFYGPWSSEQRQYLNSDVVWSLPVGQGGVLFRNAHGLLGGLLNGWQAFSAAVFFTGFPLTPPSANVVGGPGCTTYAPVGGQTHAHWFNNNESCYKPLADWQARTTPLYIGYLRVPSFFDWNAGLQKSFALPREGMSLRIRIECTNCSNTPEFAGPDTTLSDVPTFEPKIGETGFGTITTSTEGSPRYFFGSLQITF